MFEGPERKGFCQHLRAEGLGRQIRQGRAVFRLWERADADARGARPTGWIRWRGRSRALSRVARHRLNPAAYRAETLDMGKEFAEIEEERRRLEKEDYLVRQSDIHFYDFDDMKAVYDSAF